MIDPERVARESRQTLSNLGFDVPAQLPTLESMELLRPQSALSVARRAVVLVHFVMLGYEHPSENVRSALDEYALTDFASDRELGLLSDEISGQDRIDCTWLTECLQAISWCLQCAKLDFDDYCDDDLNTKFPEPFGDPGEFLESSQLRPFAEIYSMADLHYRYHWLARQGRELNISESAIRERRRALDWVIGAELDWDEVPLDT